MPRTSTLAKAAHVEPGDAPREVFAEVARTNADSAQVILRYADGTEVVVPPALIEVLRAAAGELSAGHAVTLLASRAFLSPAEAAQLLGLSRPFVARLLDDGTIPSTYLAASRHRVVLLEDVLAFAERRRKRREGRRNIAEAVDDADLPY